MGYIGFAMLVSPFVWLLYFLIDEYGFRDFVIGILITAMVAAWVMIGSYLLVHHSS